MGSPSQTGTGGVTSLQIPIEHLPGACPLESLSAGRDCSTLLLVPEIRVQRGASSLAPVLTGREHPAGKNTSVQWDSLCLWEHNTHSNTPGTHPASGNMAAPAITLNTGETGCQPPPALCLYSTTGQLLHAPCIPGCLEGKYSKHRIIQHFLAARTNNLMGLLGFEKEGHMHRGFYQVLWEGATKMLMPARIFFSKSCISSFSLLFAKA